MKKLIVIFFVFATGMMNAQSVEEAIQTTLSQLKVSDPAGMAATTNRFALIANKWNTEWVAHYYAAYSKALLGIIEEDKTKKVLLFDEAERSLEAAKSNGASENDEVYVLLAMMASMKIGIYPDQWAKYGEQFADNIKKAKQLRKENPRIYYLEGMSKFYTPEAYGGGKESARPYFEKAAEYFTPQSTSDIRKPDWGKRQNDEMLKKCSEQ
jgi:ketosteroid isomerase-like protein